MTLSDQALDAFRNSWHASEGDDFASRTARRSLEAFADTTPELKALAFELSRHAQSELDLHLSGETVVGHSTNAEFFAELIRGIAEATRELAKHWMNRERRRSTLQVLAPSPGSVRVVLQAAPPREDAGHAARETRTPTVDSDALDAVATLLARAQTASSDPASEVLSGLAAELPAKAHFGLRRAAIAIERQSWSVDGELRSVHGNHPISVDAHGAQALLRVLTERSEVRERVHYSGLIDGSRRSIGAVWFIPDGQSPIEAAVPNPELMEQVIRRDAEGRRVGASFNLVTIIGSGANARRRRVFTLQTVEPLPEDHDLLSGSLET